VREPGSAGEGGAADPGSRVAQAVRGKEISLHDYRCSRVAGRLTVSTEKVRLARTKGYRAAEEVH